MRIIVDTNVLLSAFIRVESGPYQLLQAWLDGRFELVSSTAQVDEIARVARYPQVRRYIGAAEAGWLINRIRDRALVIDRLRSVDVCPDPADNFLLAMAQTAEADCLVSGDKSGVLAIRRHEKTNIVNVSKMVAALKLGQPVR